MNIYANFAKQDPLQKTKLEEIFNLVHRTKNSIATSHSEDIYLCYLVGVMRKGIFGYMQKM